MMTLPVWEKKRWLKSDELQKGQALLIILLVLSVVLTLALSVVSRSVTEISITSSEDDSARALSAAEAGIERTLVTATSISPVTLPNSATYETEVTAVSSINNEFAYPTRLNAGESATFWFVSHDANGDLSCVVEPCFRGTHINLYWGDTLVAAPIPAIEISVYHDPTLQAVNIGNFVDVRLKRLAYDPVVGRGNSFDSSVLPGPFNIGGETYRYSTGDINIQPPFLPPNCHDVRGCVLMVVAKVFYANDVPLGIKTTTLTGGALPAQGINITSTGVSGDATRKVNVFQSYFVPPGVFESSMFSYGNLTK